MGSLHALQLLRQDAKELTRKTQTWNIRSFCSSFARVRDSKTFVWSCCELLCAYVQGVKLTDQKNRYLR